jgi:prepilin-type N-terminal cleavage/methylation domain-containing protein/prepilin-type processing-associated H-X9-DG protein
MKTNMKSICVTRGRLGGREHHRRVHPPSSAAHHAAFTFIELLVVMANLAILAAILLPALQGLRTRGREIQCRNNLKQMGMAERLYLNDNRENMFPYQPGAWLAPIESMSASVTNVILCPFTTLQPNPGVDTPGTYNLAWIAYINTSSGPSGNNGSYTFNGYLYAAASGGDNAPFYKDSNVEYPAQTPDFGDGVWVDCWPSTNDVIPSPANLQAPLSSGSLGGEAGMSRLLIARHGPYRVNPPPTNLSGRSPMLPGGINMVFMDGHVDSVALSSLWTLYWHPNWAVTTPR